MRNGCRNAKAELGTGQPDRGKAAAERGIGGKSFRNTSFYRKRQQPEPLKSSAAIGTCQTEIAGPAHRGIPSEVQSEIS